MADAAEAAAVVRSEASKSGTVVPVVAVPVAMPRRNLKSPRSGALTGLTRGPSGGLDGSKSPRRLPQDERLTFEEIKILELFKKLSPTNQNRVLDAMEDWQDEQAEAEMIRGAEEEERRIKERKLEQLRVEEEKRNVADQKRRSVIIQPALEEAARQEQALAEIARRAALVDAEGGVDDDPAFSTEKPLLQKVANLTPPVPAPRRDSVRVTTGSGGTDSAPVPPPRRDSKGPGEVLPRLSVDKSRNPKLAGMLAMIGSEEAKKGTLFADQAMTPEIPRHTKTSVMQQTQQEIAKREEAQK